MVPDMSQFTRHVSTYDLPIPEAGDIRAHIYIYMGPDVPRFGNWEVVS